MKARVIRVWKQSYRLDMIVVDERGRKVQGCIKTHLLPSFVHLIKEDAVILIRKFGVAAQVDKHPVVDLPHKINFFMCTDVEPLSTWSGHPYGFNFTPFNDIVQNKLHQLTVDVIGRLRWCGDLEIFKSSTKESKRLTFHLEDYDGNVLTCTVWGDYADQCNRFVASNQSKEMVIVVIQHGRQREWSGQWTVQNDMFATRIFMNEELDEANDLRRRLIVKDGPSTSTTVLSSQMSYPLRAEFVENTPKLHVDEIRDVDKVSTYVVVATITMIEENTGWFYTGHRPCHKKAYTKTEYLEKAKVIPANFLDAPFDSLWCLNCECLAESLVPKYKVQFRVQDSTGSVSFIMFDKDVKKILGLSAYEVRDRQMKRGDLDQFPHELYVLHNKVIAFKMIVSQHNLKKKTHAYTVGKICDDPDIIQELQALDEVDNDEGHTDSLTLEASSQLNLEPKLTQDEGHTNGIKLEESSQVAMGSKDATSFTGSCVATDLEQDSGSSPSLKRTVPLAVDEKTIDASSAVRPCKKRLTP